MTEYQPLPTSNARTAWGALNAVCRIVLEEPLRLNMKVVCVRGGGIAERSYKSWQSPVAPRGVPACGTIGCVAGWVEALFTDIVPDLNNGSDTYKARDILGLTADQTEQLFYPWGLMRETPQTIEYVAKVVAHVRAFMRANEAQLKATLLPERTTNG